MKNFVKFWELNTTKDEVTTLSFKAPPVTCVHRSLEARAHGAEKKKTEEDKIELQASATRQSAQRSHTAQHSHSGRFS